MNPIPTELMPQLAALNAVQLAWLSGYCWAKADGQAPALVSAAASTISDGLPAAAPLRITVLSASQTGNARKVADDLTGRLKAAGLAADHIHAADYKTKNLAGEQILLIVASTQGEGEPPEEAVSLHKFLFGKKAPDLSALKFAVLGLGDSSYPQFCGAAKAFDARLAELGGTRLSEAVWCDLEFQAEAEKWLERTVPLVAQHAQAAAPAAAAVSDGLTATASVYTKEHPFPATLLARQKITGRHSDKDVRHIELDLGGSGLRYTAGDALGVWFDNDADLVARILTALVFDGSESVDIKGTPKNLREALIHDLDITQNTPQFVQAYAERSGNAELQAAVSANPQAYAAAHPIADIVAHYPAEISAADFAALLRPLTPRLYSIASAPEEVGEEVHLCVGVLRYECGGERYTGGASGYLAERAEEDGQVRVFVEPNSHFRLPDNPDTPVIMIGAGTGIAPFRAFVQQRAATEAAGRNWLIFGNPHFSEDFLYQTEWQTWAKDGFLHRYSFAWSRDGGEKVYVQHKIREEAAELWQWLQQGAHVYVCGDAARMAKDVEAALLDAIAAQGGLSADDAEEYLDNLRQEKRYQRDVY